MRLLELRFISQSMSSVTSGCSKTSQREKTKPEVPSCCSPDGDRLMHALHNAENPPRDRPKGAAQNLTAASPSTEKPWYQIPKSLCCVLSKGLSMLREEVSKAGK